MLIFERPEFPIGAKIFCGLTALFMMLAAFMNKYRRIYAYMFMVAGNGMTVTSLLPKTVNELHLIYKVVGCVCTTVF